MKIKSLIRVALVKLDEGPMVTAQLTDVNAGDVKIGMRVEMVTRKLREEGDEGQIIYGYKFRPPLTESASADDKRESNSGVSQTVASCRPFFFRTSQIRITPSPKLKVSSRLQVLFYCCITANLQICPMAHL